MTRGPHRDEGPFRAMGLDADEHPTRLQVAPGPLEGMDHALDRDSSKRPAEERQVEFPPAQARPFDRADAKQDIGHPFRSELTPSD